MTTKPTKYTVTDGELVIILERDEEDPKWFLVTAPFHPGIVTQARTVDEAFEMARDAIALFAADRAEERAARAPGRKRPVRKTG